MQPASIGTAAAGPAARRGDEKHGSLRRHAAEQGDEKAEGSGPIALGGRHDLVQGAADEPALRQAAVERGNAETERPHLPSPAFHARQQAAQGADELGAPRRGNGSGGEGNDRRIHGRLEDGAMLEQNKNTSQIRPAVPP